jgi:beta-glucosidase
MAGLNLNAYRFSISWPRVLPEGKGAVNAAGLDYYDRLVDALLEKNIAPFITLYHWDLPQALYENGGWVNRETVFAFAEYARIVAGRLGDRVTNWITHNEPSVVCLLGYFTGEDAPGEINPMGAFQTAHHLFLSHGYAMQAIRAAAAKKPEVGIVGHLRPVHPASESPEDREAATRYDGVLNRFFLDPVFFGRYPEDTSKLLEIVMPKIEPGDMEIISAPIDFLGVNYYSRFVIKHDPDVMLISASEAPPAESEYSQMREIYEPGLHEMLTRMQREYNPPKMIITENGIPVPDGLDWDNRVRDYRRIDYVRNNLVQLHRAMAEGVPVTGYFHWSLMDNFEWALGYTARFGLIYVDYATQERFIKDSGHWFKRIARENGLDPNAGPGIVKGGPVFPKPGPEQKQTT